MPVQRYRKHWVRVVPASGNGKYETDLKEIQTVYQNGVGTTFAYKNQKYTIGADRLSRQIETTFDDAGRETKLVKTFTYDPVYLLPRTETVTNSDGKATTISYTYPFDYSLPPYNEMVNGISGLPLAKYNIISPVIEKRILYADQSSEIHRTDYVRVQDNKTRGYYPEYVRYTGGSGMMYERLNFGKYSPVGRPLQITRNALKNVVYLWSYHHQYPVAAIQNATYAEVNEALGGGTFIDDLSARMSPTDAQWVTINNLRTALPNALVTTCTYKPLVGKLSETDPAGLTTYYEYDTSNRLKEVYLKNSSGQKEILEAYEYNYVNK